MEVFIVTKETIVKELIRAKKESLLGYDSINVDDDNVGIKDYISDLLLALVEVDYEEELRSIWGYDIRHIHDSYYKELKSALETHDAYLFVISQRYESNKTEYIKTHWNELDKIMNTLYNLCGLNVIEVPQEESDKTNEN